MVRLGFILVFLSVVLLQFFVEHVSSQCCGSDRGGRCRDGTDSTPCCGYGRCNLFCCACRGGCRRGKRAFEDMIDNLVEDAKERRRFEDPANEADENEDDMQEEREIDNDYHSACKRQCLGGVLASHPDAEEVPDFIVKRGITDGNCKRACAYMKRGADKK